MSITKKSLILLSLPALVLVLSGCGSQTKQQNPSDVSTSTSANQNQVPASQGDSNSPNTALQENTPPKEDLGQLPADNKAAIDSEIGNIDKELKTTDNAVNTNDLSNTNLGL